MSGKVLTHHQHRWAPQRDAIEEAQGTHRLHDGGPGHLFLLDKKELIDADLLRAKMLGGAPKMLSEGGDTAQVTVNGLGGVVAELQTWVASAATDARQDPQPRIGHRV